MASAEGGRLVPSACGGRHLTFCSLQATVDGVIEVRETETFSRWLRTLHDPTAKAKVAARVRRLAFGNPGDVRPVGEGISELRIQYGPGYRVYYVQRATVLIILLCGGDKKTQVGDIATAKKLAKDAA
jgi:putative addiction module killer protein